MTDPLSSDRGGLRAAILATSRELLDQGGPAALSMREVARRAGCTHQAPYHYFPNREAILAALVAEGFTGLADALHRARTDNAGANASGIIIATGSAYIDFALSNPGVFRIMFRSDMYDPTAHPDLLEASDRARAELSALARQVFGDAVTDEAEAALWAYVHGASCLLIDGPGALGPTTTEEKRRFASRLLHSGALRP